MVQTCIPLVLPSHPLQPFLHVTWVPRNLPNCFPRVSILGLDQVGYLYPPSSLPLWSHQSPVRSCLWLPTSAPPPTFHLDSLSSSAKRQGTTSSVSSHFMKPDSKFLLKNSRVSPLLCLLAYHPLHPPHQSGTAWNPNPELQTEPQLWDSESKS